MAQHDLTDPREVVERWTHAMTAHDLDAAVACDGYASACSNRSVYLTSVSSGWISTPRAQYASEFEPEQQRGRPRFGAARASMWSRCAAATAAKPGGKQLVRMSLS